MKPHGDSRPLHEFCNKARKVAYRTRKAALTAGANTSAYLDKALRVYKCDVCRRWHLTSQTKKGT